MSRTLHFLVNYCRNYSGLLLFVVGILIIVLAFIIALFSFINILVNQVLSVMQSTGMFMFFFLLFFLAFLYSKNFKAIFFNVSVLFLTLSAVDIGKIIWPGLNLKNPFTKQSNSLEIKPRPAADTVDVSKISVYYENQQNYFTLSDVLGYAPGKNRRTHTYSKYDDVLLFDVHYSIDKNGQRVAPPFEPLKNSGSLVFFGCSYTFGYGLEDHEAFPYQVGLKTKGKYKIYNFGFNGYGTHQMLSAIEHKLLDSIISIEPKHFFYLAIPEHLKRIVNDKDWGQHDPEYVLNNNNEPEYKGSFDENLPIFIKNWNDQIKKVTKQSYVFNQFSHETEYEPYQADLFISMIKKSKKLLESKYPNSRFHVIYWDSRSDRYNVATNLVIERLENSNIDYYLASNIFQPGQMQKTMIRFPVENHPNATANKIIAEFIIEKIIKNNQQYYSKN